MNHDLTQDLTTLTGMTIGQLCQRYAELFGEQTRTRHKAYLIRKIAWRLQALAEGGLSERALQRATELANEADVRLTPPRHWTSPLPDDTATVTAAVYGVDRDPRIPKVGTALVRRYKGRMIRVIVLPDGFEYEGQRFRTLTALTHAITGSHANGFRFFNLGGRI